MTLVSVLDVSTLPLRTASPYSACRGTVAPAQRAGSLRTESAASGERRCSHDYQRNSNVSWLKALPVTGFLPPVSNAFPSQRLFCGDGTFCCWQRQKKPSRLSLGQQTEQTATCFLQMLTQKSTKFISTLRRSPAGPA